MDRLSMNEKEDVFYSPEKMKEMKEDVFYSPEKMKEMKRNDVEEKVDHLRERIGKQDSACKDVDDLTLRRFLHARDLEVEKASEMYMNYVAWKQTFVSKGSISASEVSYQIEQYKVFMQGTDKRGCPVVVVFGAKHFPCKKDTQGFKRFVVFVLDKLCSSGAGTLPEIQKSIILDVNRKRKKIIARIIKYKTTIVTSLSISRIPEGQEKFTVIGDLKGFGYSNIDINEYLAGISILQDYYPETLGRVFIVHAPYVFMTAWKMVYPFIDKNTRRKVVFVEKNKLQETLLEDIEENQLPEIYGGKMQLVPVQDG